MDIIALGAGLLSGAAYLIYIVDIIRGGTKPSRSSWWILGVVWSVLLVSSLTLVEGSTFFERWHNLAGSWISLAYIIGSFTIAALSIKKGSSDPWGHVDTICVVLAGASLVCFVIIQAPLISLLLSIVADVCGIIPTMRNAYRHPEYEHFIAWLLEVVSGAIALVAVTAWAMTPEGIADWSGPLYVFVLNAIILVILIIRRKWNLKIPTHV
jgi:hypothetical protein